MGKLFSRSSKSSPAPSENPYAQSNTSQDPYAQDNSRPSMSSFSSKGSGLPSGPRPGLPSGPRGGAPAPRAGAPPPRPGPPGQQPPPSYGSATSGYGPNNYGSGGGYGANRYKNEQNFQQNQKAPVTSQPFRSGGYGGLGDPGAGSQPPAGPPGGLGRTSSVSTDAQRGDLFGGAQNRYDPQRQNAYDRTAKPVTGYGQSGASAAGSGSYGGSGAYSGYGEERELTEEEQAERAVQNTMAETSQIRDESYQSTNRTLQQMYNTLDVGQDTMANLSTQGERLRNAERNMDRAENYNISGYDKAKELQKANSSMFAVHVSNPFTAKKRAQAQDDAVMERHRAEKGQREATRSAHWSEARLVENKMRGMTMNDEPSYKRPPKKENKYIFDEEDSEEERKEEAIDRNLDEMYMVSGQIKKLATGLGDVVDDQTRIIDRIAKKTDYVDDGVRRNRNELDKVR